MPGAAHANILTASGPIKAVLDPEELLYSSGAFSLGVVLFRLLAVKIFVYIVLERNKKELISTVRTIR